MLTPDSGNTNIKLDTKLDFSDVLIRPRPSALSSRRDVDIKRKFNFPHSTTVWTGFPLVASNMDATGTLRMANALSEYDALTALSKYYEVKKIVGVFSHTERERLLFNGYL